VTQHWLNYGEQAYGEMYEEAIEATGLKYGTLRNDKYVAKRVEFSLRSENLSWHCHKEVAPLEPQEQDFWLEQAEQGQWTVRELRAEIN